MTRFALFFGTGLLLALVLAWHTPFRSQAQGEATPTPPPPPLATNTPPPSNPPTLPPNPGGGGKKPTVTPTPRPPGGGGGNPPVSSGTPEITPTETPTPTLTPTPTMPPTLLRLVVYMDANGNGEFDTGEGVENLLALARWETWLTYGYTVQGTLTFSLPPDVPPGVQIAVEAPYLHWSSQVKAPVQSGFAETALKLGLPEFPVFLP